MFSYKCVPTVIRPCIPISKREKDGNLLYTYSLMLLPTKVKCMQLIFNWIAYLNTK